MLLIKNGKIITMSGDVFENGSVVCSNGKIEYVGDSGGIKNFDITDEIDAGGNIVMPGMIDAHCHCGMFEDSMGFEGDDANEATDPATPHLRAIDGINPNDRCFKDACKAGITTVVTGPGSANPISGQFAAVKTAGTVIDDMILKAPQSIKMSLGENPKTVYKEKNQLPTTRMGTAAVIREQLYAAKEYKAKWDRYNANPADNDRPDFDIRADALLPLIEKKIPAKIHAHRSDDIATALRLAKEFDINVTIEHATDGVCIAETLKSANARLMVGPSLCERSKIELKNLSFDTCKILSDAGLDIAIITDHPVIPVEYLPLCASLAVKSGMDRKKALEALTVNSAKNCYLDDRIGTLEKGKDADIIIVTKPPVEFDYEVIATIINGEIKYRK